jgi:adenine phosphoribosyltransferase
MDLKSEIREIPDFPKVGISFKDITTLLKNEKALQFTIDTIASYFSDKNITKVLGIESRGFILGGAIAKDLGAGFIPVRKKGKLPGKTIFEEYDLEYGMDCVELHADALNQNDVVLIHDDLLATGGTAFATMQMARRIGIQKIYFSFICDLEFIKTDKKAKIMDCETQVLVKY